MRVRISSAPAAAGTDLTARLSDLRLFAAQVEGGNSRTALDWTAQRDRACRSPMIGGHGAPKIRNKEVAIRRSGGRAQHCLRPDGRPSRCMLTESPR